MKEKTVASLPMAVMKALLLKIGLTATNLLLVSLFS